MFVSFKETIHNHFINFRSTDQLPNDEKRINIQTSYQSNSAKIWQDINQFYDKSIYFIILLMCVSGFTEFANLKKIQITKGEKIFFYNLVKGNKIAEILSTYTYDVFNNTTLQ